ncbi:NAD(P)-binding domain-containing protein [Mesorhizobium sp. Cs1321R2N1]|uniref:NAD(P)-binding domain-containing protein n=1 Tax=Mesorhizobium sp. Cs1321R2N1 TaxID=3015174 RepID=UPI00301DF3B4
MDTPTIGVLGTGDFAAYFIAALRNGGYTGHILLSPHSPAKAERLAAEQGCTVASDDTAMLAESDWLLLAVRPEQLPSALPKLALRSGQLLLSAVAGLTVDELRSAIGNDVAIIRIMPSSYIGVLQDGLLPIYPGCAEVEAVLGRAGKLLVFDTEKQIELSMIGACLSGWMYRFVGSLEAWFVERGLTPAQARQIVAGNILGAAGNALARPDISLETVSDEIATPGTYTQLGLDYLRDKNSFHPWNEALTLVSDRLNLKR